MDRPIIVLYCIAYCNNLLQDIATLLLVKGSARVKHWIDAFTDYGRNDQMCTVINERNHKRLESILGQSEGQTVVGGEQTEPRSLKMKTIVVDGVTMKDALLSEELFGPILPIVEADHKTAADIIASLPHPLAIYIFSHTQSEIDYDEHLCTATTASCIDRWYTVLNNTSSGGVTINDIFVHAAVPGVPFGGVGK